MYLWSRLLALFLLPFLPAAAQDVTWQPAGAPPSAGLSFVAHDTSSGVTLASDGTRLFRLEAGATTWEPAAGLPDALVDLEALPSGAFVASTYRAGLDPVGTTEEAGTVWRSDDGGRSWTPTSVANEPGRFILAVGPDGTIFAAHFATVLRSSDGGHAWEQWMGPGVGVDYAGVDGAGRLVVVSQDMASRAFSADRGETWTSVPGRTDTAIRSFALDADGRCYAGLQNFEDNFSVGAMPCFEEGHGDPGAGLPALPVDALAVDDGGVVFAGTAGGGLYRSTDRGQTWDFVGLAGRFIRALVAGPDGLLLAGTSEGLYRSADAGATWALVRDGLASPILTALLPLPGGTMLVGTSGSGLFLRTPDGAWQQQPFPSLFVHTLHRTAEGVIFAGTEHGLYRAAVGAAWDTLAFPRYRADGTYWNASVRTLTEAADGTLYAGLFPHAPYFGEIYRSDDGGQTWETTAFVSIPDRRPGGISSLVALPGGAVLNAGRGVHRYSPSDAAWTDVTPPGPAPSTAAMAHPHGFVLVSTTSALLRSENDGETWEVITTTVNNAKALVGGYDGFPFFAATPAGIFTADDDEGRTWHETETPPGVVQVLALDEQGMLWAGTAADGLYRSRYPTGTIASREAVPTRPAATLAAFPNPFRQAATLQFVLPRPGFVRLVVRDVLGRTVATLLAEWRPAGTGEVVLPAGGLANGTYYVTLEVEGERLTRPLLLAR